MDKVLQIESFNPYDRKFPDRKTITFETLVLIKYLKKEGYTVKVLPSDDRPVEYLFKKGFAEYFSDPVIMFLVGIPSSIILNIVSNYIQRLLDRDKGVEVKINVKNFVVIENQNNHYDCRGGRIKTKEFKKLVENGKLTKESFGRQFAKQPPYFDKPVPMFYEHRPKIVGWCRPIIDDKGIRVEDGVIKDREIMKKLDKGKIKGASVCGIATRTICSICNENFVECEHLPGEIYDGEECYNQVYKADLVEVSLVKTPVNPECLIGLRK